MATILSRLDSMACRGTIRTLRVEIEKQVKFPVNFRKRKKKRKVVENENTIANMML